MAAIMDIIAITVIAAIGRPTATVTHTPRVRTMAVAMAAVMLSLTMAVAMVMVVRASRSASAVAAAGNKKPAENAGFFYDVLEAFRASPCASDVARGGAFQLAQHPIWSGRRESNPRMQLGKLPFYH